MLCLIYVLFYTGIAAISQVPDSEFREKALQLQHQLNLTGNQTIRLSAIFKAASQKFGNIERADRSDYNKLLVDAAELRRVTISKIRLILSKPQAIKFDHLLITMSSGGNDGWSRRP